METTLSFLKWLVLLVCLNLLSGIVHPDAIQITGPIFALFMLVMLLPKYADKPFMGLAFSLLVIFISAAFSSILLMFVGCKWYSEISICRSDYFSALSFGFFAFPALIIVPWGAMIIGSFFRSK